MEDIKLLLDNSVQCVHIMNFYPKKYCEILLNRIKNINKENIKPWRYSKNKNHDVSVFQIPLSDVFNNLKTPEEYFNQKDWNLYKGIISPIEYFINNYNDSNHNLKKGRDDCIINHFPIYKKYKNSFLESIIRIYKPNTYHKDGLSHIDIDETGYYNNYNIFTINVYLQVPRNGGTLTIGNKKIKPSCGDLIIFNPGYYHSVEQSIYNDRISVQSFILSNKKKKEIFIRT